MYGITPSAKIDAFEKAQKERKIETGMIFHSDFRKSIYIK